MIKLNHALLREVKQGFVPQGGQEEPVAGAGPMTAGLAGGGMGGDPAAGGGAPPPMDPSMAGGAGGMPPMDPNMQGMPPPPPPGAGGAPGGDPNAQASQAGSPPITLSIDDFIRILESVAKISGGGKGGKSQAPAAGAPAVAPAPSDPKLDHIIGLLGSAMGGAGAPPPMH